MKKYTYYILSLIGFLTLSFSKSNKSHEYFVCVTELEHSKKEKSVQITSQIFIDDLEELLRERYDDAITLSSRTGIDATGDSYVERYLKNKLVVKINGQQYKLNYIGKEYKEDIAYCYLEIRNINQIKKVEVTNQILFDMFDSQQNIVRLKMNNKNKSFLLMQQKDKCLLNFD